MTVPWLMKSMHRMRMAAEVLNEQNAKKDDAGEDAAWMAQHGGWATGP